MSEVCFFNPFTDIRKYRNLLPHWQQPGATYFITFRMGDSIPADRLARWRSEREAWILQHPKPWSFEVERQYHDRFSRKIDTWLDRGHGACSLRVRQVRVNVETTLLHSDDIKYLLHSYVIMPNHVHLLVSLHEEAELEKEVGAWKSISARTINRSLGRRGAFWQEDYFDRLIRDQRHFENCVRYIRRNPEKALLRAGEHDLYENKLARIVV